MLDSLVTIVSLGISAGFISLTITRSKFFEFLRDFFFAFSTKSKTSGFIYDLISCPYCFSHWVALIMTIIWKPILTNSGYLLLDIIVSWFMIIGIASYSWAVYSKISND